MTIETAAGTEGEQISELLFDLACPASPTLNDPVHCIYLESYNTQLSFGLSGNFFSASYEASEFCCQIGLNFLQHMTLVIYASKSPEDPSNLPDDPLGPCRPTP